MEVYAYRTNFRENADRNPVNLGTLNTATAGVKEVITVRLDPIAEP